MATTERDRRRLLRRLLFVLLATLIAVAVVPTRGEASFPGRNGNIGFTLHGYYYDADTDDSGSASYLRAISPSGARDRRFERRIRRLRCSGCEQGSYSPSGRRLAVTSFFNREFIRILSPSDGRSRFLVEGSAPVWSPRGTQLAFMRQEGFPRPYGIYTISADGSGLRRLTEGRFPAWSSRGEIAFQRRDGIYVMRSDGMHARRIRPALCSLEEEARTCLVDWSPDGRQLVYARRSAHSDAALRVISRTGAPVRGLAEGPWLESAAWSPDGRQIAFVRYEQLGSFAEILLQEATIWVVSSRGGPARRLVTSGQLRKMFGRETWEYVNVRYLDWQPLPG